MNTVRMSCRLAPRYSSLQIQDSCNVQYSTVEEIVMVRPVPGSRWRVAGAVAGARTSHARFTQGSLRGCGRRQEGVVLEWCRLQLREVVCVTRWCCGVKCQMSDSQYYYWWLDRNLPNRLLDCSFVNCERKTNDETSNTTVTSHDQPSTETEMHLRDVWIGF